MTVRACISLVTLGVEDIERSTRFYRALGWELSTASVAGEVSFFRTQGAILALYGTQALAADAELPAPAARTDFRGVTIAVNCESEAEVDEALAIAAQAGARIVKPAQRTDWGGYGGYFADPDGHVIEVAFNAYWPLDDKGLPILP